MALQTHFYRWMEVITIRNGEQTFLARPRSNEYLYEDVVDWQFDTEAEAYDWRSDEIENWNEELDPDEIEYINSWVLVHTVNTVIGDDAFED